MFFKRLAESLFYSFSKIYYFGAAIVNGIKDIFIRPPAARLPAVLPPPAAPPYLDPDYDNYAGFAKNEVNILKVNYEIPAYYLMPLCYAPIMGYRTIMPKQISKEEAEDILNKVYSPMSRFKI